jgi:hypothetical protein
LRQPRKKRVAQAVEPSVWERKPQVVDTAVVVSVVTDVIARLEAEAEWTETRTTTKR